MFQACRTRAKKAGQPPGTLVYTGSYDEETTLTRIIYSESDFQEIKSKTLQNISCNPEKSDVTWIQVQGLKNVELIEQLAEAYHIHPLTIEDILNVHQRPKIEEFEQYVFITLSMFILNEESDSYVPEQVSFILGTNFLISFQEHETALFHPILERLRGATNQRLRQHGSDYLAYRLIDAIIDRYFIALEALGDQLENIEEEIVNNPKPENTRELHHLKQQLMLLRKTIWPTREAISHLLHNESAWITPFTRVYLRDLYDHVMQALDTVETFRDMLAGMLDIYLSSLTNRMNEVIKTLTIIATIFIPITFITSFYGMNFTNIPMIKWRYGYYFVLGTMGIMVMFMFNYFRKKKWL